jgi:hypothetical protein
MMIRPKVRQEDSGETPVWRSRGIQTAVKVALFLAGVLTALGLVRVVPGGIVIGSASDVRALGVRVDSADHALAEQRQELYHIDSTHSARLQRVEKRQDAQLDIQRAQVRDRCGEIGYVKAKRIGYPCEDAAAHLPQTP